MYFKNKGQMSLEFVMVLVFGFVVVALIMYGIGVYIVSLNSSQLENQREDIAQSILNEFRIAEDVLDGYERTYIIDPHIINRYNLTINETDRYLIMHDTEQGHNFDEAIYHVIGGDIPFEFSVNATGHGNLTIRTPSNFPPYNGESIQIS